MWFLKTAFSKKINQCMHNPLSNTLIFSNVFPEKGGFTVLIVLGKKESEKALSIRDELSSEIHKLLGDTEQLHDGRWLRI
jgi:hypothetical protein